MRWVAKWLINTALGLLFVLLAYMCACWVWAVLKFFLWTHGRVTWTAVGIMVLWYVLAVVYDHLFPPGKNMLAKRYDQNR